MLLLDFPVFGFAESGGLGANPNWVFVGQVCYNVWFYCVQVLESKCYSCNCVSDGACSRTLKVFMAILNGRWILTMDWIKACVEANHYVDEEPYEVNLDNHGCCDGAKTGRSRASNNRPSIIGLTTQADIGYLFLVQLGMRLFISHLVPMLELDALVNRYSPSKTEI
ncbi:protein breast cancer susceptibility 1 homolog [Phtheirospermum japonicum]|uniref:Protein breast cancer susceptibility 1 homolog n=1 Tax=Phtheirospermum japonicum TaxID=374723 RepID=A0A830CTJ2_9LAMI|nr:protein breast cancer susceptibility 1 homolog [Phtheirospermum japonicum]